MLVSVAFLHPIVAEPWPGGTNHWSAKSDGERGIECTDKGTHMLISWTSKSDVFRGRACRVKVPLTNIAQVFEVDELKKEKP